MSRKKILQTCPGPDVDVPGLICGHPLPCPRHPTAYWLGHVRGKLRPCACEACLVMAGELLLPCDEPPVSGQEPRA